MWRKCLEECQCPSVPGPGPLCRSTLETLLGIMQCATHHNSVTTVVACRALCPCYARSAGGLLQPVDPARVCCAGTTAPNSLATRAATVVTPCKHHERAVFVQSHPVPQVEASNYYMQSMRMLWRCELLALRCKHARHSLMSIQCIHTHLT